MAYLEDLVADERFELVKELKESKDTPDYDTKLLEVRMCERLLRFIRGAKEDAGW